MDDQKLWELKLDRHAAWLRGRDDGEQLHLRECIVRGEDLSKLDLRSANITRVEFIDCDLRGINLQSSLMRQVSFTDCDFSGANLQKANLRNSKFDRSNLSNSDLRETVFVSVGFNSVIFDDSVLDGADFFRVNTSNISLQRISCAGINHWKLFSWAGLGEEPGMVYDFNKDNLYFCNKVYTLSSFTAALSKKELGLTSLSQQVIYRLLQILAVYAESHQEDLVV